MGSSSRSQRFHSCEDCADWINIDFISNENRKRKHKNPPISIHFRWGIFPPRSDLRTFMIQMPSTILYFFVAPIREYVITTQKRPNKIIGHWFCLSMMTKSIKTLSEKFEAKSVVSSCQNTSCDLKSWQRWTVDRMPYRIGKGDEGWGLRLECFMLPWYIHNLVLVHVVLMIGRW